MGYGRTWTKDEIEYLEDKWSYQSVKYITKKLKRTEIAVMSKAYQLGLGSPYTSSEYLNINQIANILGVDYHALTDYWIPKCGLKAQRVRMLSQLMWRIKITDLIQWLRDNQDLWDSRKVDFYDLGTEPEWLKEKRRSDMVAPQKRFKKWDVDADSILISYYKHGLSQQEISERMSRTVSGVQRRISRLKERGLLSKCKVMVKWLEREEAEFRRLEAQGLSDTEIGEELGRDRQHIVDHRRNLRVKRLHDGKRMVMCG